MSPVTAIEDQHFQQFAQVPNRLGQLVEGGP